MSEDRKSGKEEMMTANDNDRGIKRKQNVERKKNKKKTTNEILKSSMQ